MIRFFLSSSSRYHHNFFRQSIRLGIILILTLSSVKTVHAHSLPLEHRDLIVGGKEAPIDYYNWFVRVENRAGVLVAPQFFITKANYAETIVAQESISRIGFLCNQSDNCGQYYEDRMVKNVFIHPDYEMGGPNLMLVQLNDTSTVTPSRMDHGRLGLSYQTGQGNLVTAGFGTIDVETGIMSDRLLHLEQNFLSNDECVQAVADSTSFNITSHVMCAVHNDSLKSPCYYDGGGPLYDISAKKLVGIVSTGADDCKSYPTVYERIGPVYEWIKGTICREHSEQKPSFCVAQNTYFNVVSEFEDDGGLDWCLTRRDNHEEAQVIVEICSESEHQLWKIDRRGQIRSFHNKTLCIENVKGEKKFSMKPCPTRKEKSKFTFVFDSINKSLIWLNNRANFQRWGLRAVALIDIPLIDNEASKTVHVRERDDDILQKWRIEYPDM
mmetsp:Transcript_9172/g.17272  ORF Transcript_9172/g.17272 Transcript_9172/m.17272 type:complete len:440 (+) Transcript_9172:110-1429(+)